MDRIKVDIHLPRLEELYDIKTKQVDLYRVKTKSGKWLEVFESPVKTLWEGNGEVGHWTSRYKVEIVFPEFTCLCPKTAYPDFAEITLKYIPNSWCVELKSWKYYLGSFRNEGHFHEAVCNGIYSDLIEVLEPIALQIIGKFNVRGGTYPTIRVGQDV
jgi:7-cyano-7-deazaguanine reductase